MKDRRIFIIFFLVLVDMLSFSIVLPLLPYLGKSLGASTWMLGILGACYPLAQTIASPLLGRLSDKIGRKPVLAFSIAGTVVGFVILALSQTPRVIAWGATFASTAGLPINAIFFVLLISRLIDGATGGNVSVAQAYLADITSPENRSAAMGLIGAAFGIGFIIGPVTGGLLYGFSHAAPAWLGAVLAAINVVSILMFLPESLSREERLERAADKPKLFTRETIDRLFGHPAVAPLLTARALTGVSFAIFEGGFALWALTALKISAGSNAILLTYVGVLSVIMQGVIIRPLTKRFRDEQLLISASFLVTFAFFLWGLVTHQTMLWVIMPLFSVGMATINTVLTSGLSKAVVPSEVGSILGVQTSITSVTRAIGPLAAALLLQAGTLDMPRWLGGEASIPAFPWPGWIGALFCFVSAITVMWLANRIRCGKCGPI